MVVFVAIQAWPSFAHNGLSLVRLAAATSTSSSATMVNTAADPPPLDYHAARVAADLRHAADDRPRRRARPRRSRSSRRSSSSSSRRRGCAASSCPVVRLLAAVPSVIYGLIGILVLVAVRRQPPRSRTARKKSVQYVVQLVGHEPARRRRDPHGDDHADHDRDHRRRALRRSRAAGRRARSRSASTAGGRCGRCRVRAARPAIVAGAVLAMRPRAGRGDHALDGLGLDGLRARTRSTA